MDKSKDDLVGIEFEMTGDLTRQDAIKVVIDVLNKKYSLGINYENQKQDRNIIRINKNTGHAYIKDQKHKGFFQIVNDISIESARSDKQDCVELVTPILKVHSKEDMQLVENIINSLKKQGATVNNSCGVHVHINASNHTPKTLISLMNIMAKVEPALYDVLNIDPDRKKCYCQPINKEILQKLNKGLTKEEKDNKNMSWISFFRTWYDKMWEFGKRKDNTRYRGLNLHDVFLRKAIEFRYFPASLNMNEVESYIDFCYRISNFAINNDASKIKNFTNKLDTMKQEKFGKTDIMSYVLEKIDAKPNTFKTFINQKSENKYFKNEIKKLNNIVIKSQNPDITIPNLNNEICTTVIER